MENPQQFVNEFLILAKLDHPNILNIIEVWEWNNLLFIVTAYYEGGELYDYVESKKFLEEHEVFKFVQTMVGVLTYLKENNITHRDIKLENFLLTDKDDISSIKLIDFGLSKDMTYNTLTKTNVGTPFYVAPEVVMNKEPIEGCDMWSLGVVAYIMLSGKVPFPGTSSGQIINNVLNQEVHFAHS